MPSRLVLLSCAAAMALTACTLPPAEPAPPAAVAPVVVAPAPEANLDLAMLRLAERSGCTACHQVDRPVPDEEEAVPAPRPPVGPFWRDVANRYRDQPSALQRLSATVSGGSRPQAPHWRDVAGLSMPPNRPLASSEEVQQLVRWILALPESPPEQL
ncbi:MAG TPA: cytochrome C552 [Ideonella sp.]|uniref:c-type cytochrome n=1 Tax=Ideonella sp. TaxID=1929293 RepID=UPI002CB981EF|nr:cytochrome C552 [Ideonella sp.]HSI48254.1 cytochrome C552 [Ideonella sp.]